MIYSDLYVFWVSRLVFCMSEPLFFGAPGAIVLSAGALVAQKLSKIMKQSD